jgi:hypothetical protein
MGDLRPAKDIIKALPKGIQLDATQDVATELQRQQTEAAAVATADAVSQILALQPPLTLEDANQLVAWQEAREAGRPVTP